MRLALSGFLPYRRDKKRQLAPIAQPRHFPLTKPISLMDTVYSYSYLTAEHHHEQTVFRITRRP